MTSYRADFPIYDAHPQVIYLDSAASTHKPQAVVDAVDAYISSSYSNIGRSAYALAEQSDELYYQSKVALADLI